MVYALNFFNVIRDHGPYDVVHSHCHHFSGIVVWLAKLAGVPMRIAHCHSDRSTVEAQSGLMRKSYLRLTELLLRTGVTHGLAASEQAAADLFGQRWKTDPRFRTLYCGIDLEPFKKPYDRASVRNELGIPEGAFVVGHVGRFAKPKNHMFILNVFKRLIEKEKQAYLLLVGDGPLRSAIKEYSEELNIGNRVIFAGSRNDVPRLMKGAMDVFVLPSLFEGLGLVLIEAQAAGLPCIISDVIPNEADVVPSSIKRMSLKDKPVSWAEVIFSFATSDISMEVKNFKIVKDSKFNIVESINDLTKLYQNTISQID